jgi:hypothetical protein
MRNVTHSANTHLNYKSRWKERDAVSSKRHGESCDDIRLACHLWLLKRCPGYAEEHAEHVEQYARSLGKPRPMTARKSPRCPVTWSAGLSC